MRPDPDRPAMSETNGYAYACAWCVTVDPHSDLRESISVILLSEACRLGIVFG
jgi:hypothetical protein